MMYNYYYYYLIVTLLSMTFRSIQSSDLKFPDDFKFGAATASYQIEGAWNENGKGENIWDRLTHAHPKWITDSSNGDIACDSYHKFKEDVTLLHHLGVDFYRFSLSWSRILPTGHVNQINPDGVAYYNDLINTLHQYNITPMVTLYHWDLPEPLQELGGWTNPIMDEYFADYVNIAFKMFGDRVKWWITFNEPPQICQSGYGDGDNAPAYTIDGIGPYWCGHTLLLAHAKAYHLYNKRYRDEQQGKVGITINANWFEPESNSTENLETAERYMQMTLGWWAHPIYSKSGDYPTVMKARIKANSMKESFPRTRLAPFTQDQIDYIRGTSDFFGLNHYTSLMVRNQMSDTNIPSYKKDLGGYTYYDPKWPSSAAPWLKVVPWGFRKLLNWIRNEYGNPDVIITENGYADTGEIHDYARIKYYKQYLQALLEAIHLDSCNVKGYAAWSLMDNFEWRQGYTQRFGLYHVDFNSSNRTRKAKDSANVYKNIIKTRIIEQLDLSVQVL